MTSHRNAFGFSGEQFARIFSEVNTGYMLKRNPVYFYLVPIPGSVKPELENSFVGVRYISYMPLNLWVYDAKRILKMGLEDLRHYMKEHRYYSPKDARTAAIELAKKGKNGNCVYTLGHDTRQGFFSVNSRSGKVRVRVPAKHTNEKAFTWSGTIDEFLATITKDLELEHKEQDRIKKLGERSTKSMQTDAAMLLLVSGLINQSVYDDIKAEFLRREKGKKQK